MEPHQSTQLPTSEEVQQLFDRFQHLYNQAAELILPENTHWLLWLREPPNPKSWLQRLLFYLTREWLTNLSWLIASFLWVYISLRVTGKQIPVNATQTTSSPPQVFAISTALILGMSALSIPLAYGRVLVFISLDTRYERKFHRSVVVGTLLLSLVISVFIVWDTNINTFVGWFLIWVFGVLPSFTFSLMLLTHALTSAFIWIKKFASFHHSSFNEGIKHLILNPIQTNDQEWWLVSMNKRQRNLLKDWTASSLNNIEKRFWPTVIFLGVIGVLVDVFTNVSTFQSVIDNFLNWLASIWYIVSFQAIPQTVTPNLWIFWGAVIIGFIIATFVMVIGNLLRAMLIQGFILEACIWTEYYSKSDHPEPSAENSEITTVSTWTEISKWFKSFA